MRQRSKSVFVTKEALKEQFEENHHSENDEESSDDASTVDNGSFFQNVTIKTEKSSEYTFSVSETTKLIKLIKAQIPADDTNRYNNRFEKINWEEIKIPGRTPDELKSFFKSLLSKARCYRLLNEIISEIEVSLGSSDVVVGKPKPPPTPVMLYSKDHFNKVKEENPGLNHQKLQEILKRQFEELSVKKRERIQIRHEELKNQYEKQLEIYYQQYPKEQPKSRKPKKKPVSPVELFIVEKREEGTKLNKIELLNEWKKLSMDEKVPYIRESFTYQQNDKDSKYISSKEVDKLKEHYGKPKNFISPFALFSSENAHLVKEGTSFADRSKLFGNLWRELDPKEKDKVGERYLKYKKKYEVLYSEYLNRLPSELVILAENLTALPDTPYNLFLKDVRSKNPTANVKEEWDNLSRTKRVKWILKSFEIQESAKEADYKKLVSYEELTIIYKTLGKPMPHQNVYTMFKSTLADKSSSEGEEHSTSWKNLPKKEKNMYKQNFIEHRNDFKEQFAQYLLRLPEVCRKSEIFNSKIITDFEKNDIFMMMKRLSGDHRFNSVKEELTEDNKRKMESDDEEDEEENEDEDEQTSPQRKKVKKNDSEKTPQQLRKRSLSSDESEDELVSENLNKSGKKNQSEEIKSKKGKKNKRDESFKEVEIEAPKSTKKSKKDKSVVEEEIDEPFQEVEIKISKKGKKNKNEETIKEEEVEQPTNGKKSKERKPVKEEQMESPVKAKRNKKEDSNKKKVEEPVVPATSPFNYYKQKVYRGKPENLKASWAKLPVDKKESIKKKHSELNNKYLNQLKEYLRSLSETEVLEYSRKKMELKASSDEEDDSGSEDESSADDSD